MKIPIANVYYLLLYAWRHAQKIDLTRAESAPHTELVDLFGDAIATEAARILSTGLACDYVTAPVNVPGVRGKLNLGATVKQQLLGQAKTICDVDDFEHDVVRNRILKATVRSLLNADRLDEVLRKRLRRIYAKLDRIADIRLTAGDFRRVQASRHTRRYDFILRVCRLVFDHSMVTAGSGRTTFHDFRQDDARMWQIFEHFIGEFFRIEQHQFSVSSPRIEWHDAEGTESDLAYLPTMQTDVVLESPERCVIVDAKFYPEALRGRFGGQRVHSGHLYQLFTYIENRAAATPQRPVEGMLLYPVVTQRFAFNFVLKGRKIAVRSIDLGQPWKHIHRDMLALLE